MRIVRGAGNGPCRVQIPASDIGSSLVNPRSRHQTIALHFMWGAIFVQRRSSDGC
nr:MAG TPA: hypothetical protein [Caudoviricetes sp.]